MVERPIDIRIVGQGNPERVFVVVRKSFHAIENKVPADLYGENKILEMLSSRPAYSRSSETGDTGPFLVAGPLFEEDYTLCFLRDPPSFSRSSTKVLRPPGNAKFTHTLVPNRHLLFCWSSLTYNAHLIHLDPVFARQEYGASDLLVHGPLTLFLVLEWFLRQLSTYAKNNELRTFHMRSINYKNLLPLYVDQPMKLCMKPSEFPKPGELAPKWDVWIEKDLEDGVSTMAFRGEIELSVANLPPTHETSPSDSRNTPRSWARGQPELDERVRALQPKSIADSGRIKPGQAERKPETKENASAEEAIEFESPFFP